MSQTTRRGIPKWARILIPTVLIVAWLAASGIGGPYFGKVDEVADSDLSAFLPKSSEAAKVNDAAAKFRSDETIPGIVLFEARDGKKLTDAQVDSIESAVSDVQKIEGVADSKVQLIKSDDGKAAFVPLPVETNGEADRTVAAMNAKLDNANIQGVSHWITGPAGFLADLSVAFAGIDGVLLLTALAVVFVILLFVYRSPILPVLVLVGAISALSAALFVVWWLAKWGVLQLNGQVQGILFILVIGAATDYSLLLVSRYREELYVHKDRLVALKAAWRGSLEPILASGGTVAVGLLCLLVSDLGSNKALGPVGAIGVAFSMLAALTFLPATLYAVGRVGFWPRIPHADKESVAKHTTKLQKGSWHRVGDFVAKHPRPIWIVTAVLLLAAAVNLTQLKAEGVPQSDLVLGYSAARGGQQALNRHFPDGSGTPMLVLVPVSERDDIVALLDEDKGIDGVTATATGVDAGFKPLGKQAESIKSDIRDAVKKELNDQKAKIYEQADAIEAQAGPYAGPIARQQFLDNVLPKLPSVESLVDKAYPFKDAVVTAVDGNALLSATLVDEPYSVEAEQTVKRVRQELSSHRAVLIGGPTAVTIDTNAASEHDRSVIIPLVLLAITIILMLLLRSILAPLLLLATTVVSFCASLGVAALLFNHLWHFPGADPSVILYSFVFLVALGIDYNIFLMTRVREESLKLGTRKGVIKGLVVTGGVITSAGLVLAATFAALSVIPILFLAQIAFIVSFGVLLDTIIVRSLLVPALIRDIGSVVWWPSKLRDKR